MTAPATDSLSGIVEIVAGLEPSLRGFLRTMPDEGQAYTEEDGPIRMADKAERLDLIYTSAWKQGWEYRPTPLGLAVKQHMEKES